MVETVRKFDVFTTTPSGDIQLVRMYEHTTIEILKSVLVSERVTNDAHPKAALEAQRRRHRDDRLRDARVVHGIAWLEWGPQLMEGLGAAGATRGATSARREAPCRKRRCWPLKKKT